MWALTVAAIIERQGRFLVVEEPNKTTGLPVINQPAGHVEPGESVLDAVRREVREETAVEVDRVEYRGSQPWPFPASLMLAFRAHAATTRVAMDDEELTDARWFTRAELTAAVHRCEVVLPGPASIAHALVEDWYGAPLPAQP